MASFAIDTTALERLPVEKQAVARQLLRELEAHRRGNPLLFFMPHPKQVELMGCHAPIRAFLGGNRSGKTTAGVVDDLIQAVDRDCLPEHLKGFKKWEPPFFCRIMAPDFTGTMEGVIFEKIRQLAPKSQLRGGSWDAAYDKQRRMLWFENGSWFQFMSYEQDRDKLGGAALHRVHYDEEPPEQHRVECQFRLIDYSGDELFTMTPLMGMSWMFERLYEPFKKGLLPEALIVEVDMDDNPHLDEATKQRALLGLSPEERAARKSGNFVHFAGLIYPEFSVDSHVVPMVREIPVENMVIVGIDPGFRHMAAAVFCMVSPEGEWTVFDEVALKGRTIREVCEEVLARNVRWGRTPRWYVIDPASRNRSSQTGRSDQMEYADYGVVTIAGQNSVVTGLQRVKGLLAEGRLLIGSNCEVTIDQFRKYRWESAKRAEGDGREQPVKKDDHLLDALRYAVMSRPRPSERSVEEIVPRTVRMLEQDMKGVSDKPISGTFGPGQFV
jgi:phage terminase large subunit-like protein